MDPLIWRAVERIVATLTGTLLVYLGYRLFLKLPEETDGEGRFKLPGNISVYISRVGPGAFFALFGASIVMASFYFGVRVGDDGQVSLETPTGGGGYVSYLGGAGTSPEENRANISGDIYELNRMMKALGEDPGDIRTEDFEATIRRVKLALVGLAWGEKEGWGDYAEFRNRVEAGKTNSLSSDFPKATALFNQGL